MAGIRGGEGGGKFPFGMGNCWGKWGSGRDLELWISAARRARHPLARRAPHPCPLPRPVMRAREGVLWAALGEGGCGLHAWCLYVVGGGERWRLFSWGGSRLLEWGGGFFFGGRAALCASRA